MKSTIINKINYATKKTTINPRMEIGLISNVEKYNKNQEKIISDRKKDMVLLDSEKRSFSNFLIFITNR